MVLPEARRQPAKFAGNRWVWLSVLALACAVSYLALPLDFDIDDYLRVLPGYYHNEDTGRSIEELIRSRGFQPETHHVRTADDYILTVNRIINPLVSPSQRIHLRPVLLQHGYQCNALSWMINTPGYLNDNGQYIEYDETGQPIEDRLGNTLAFVLASHGYDVWLANYRGNIFSLNHTRLDPKRDSAYWNFTIDEMVEFDLPEIISYIQKSTGFMSIGYVGHSQGTIMMFALLSSKPEYANVVRPFIAMAPNPYLGQIKSPLRQLGLLEKHFGYFSGRPTTSFHFGVFQKFLARLCENRFLQSTCYLLLKHGLGIQQDQFTMNRIGVFMSNLPTGSSSMNSAHIIQMINKNQPQKYDYGPVMNRMAYGQDNPPPYPISEINSTSIALIYTANDWLNDVEDVETLKSHLKVPLLDDYLVPEHHWNHMELLWAKEAGTFVNSRVLEILKKSMA